MPWEGTTKHEVALHLKRQAALAIIAAGIGVLVSVLKFHTDANEGLLTATAILTGLTFSLALQLWQRSLDARSDPNSVPTDQRQAYGDMQSRLLWTVIGGLLSTGWIAGVLIVAGDSRSTTSATGVTAALIAYQLLNVVAALLSLHERHRKRQLDTRHGVGTKR